jgi:hypothetical protein
VGGGLAGTGIVSAPGLRDQITLLIRKGALKGTAPEATALAITTLVYREASTRCRDRDCARLFPHSRLSRHLPRHEPEPPFELFVFAWLCSRCGYRRGHRVHRLRKERP